MSGGNGVADPFADGVWIYCVADGRNMLALVEGSYDVPPDMESARVTEDKLIDEMLAHRSICVTLKRKYVLATVGYAMKVSTSQLAPAFLNALVPHEMLIEMSTAFETHAVLHSFTFLSAFTEQDRAEFRNGVLRADEAMALARRAKASNIVAPTQAEKAHIMGKGGA